MRISCDRHSVDGNDYGLCTVVPACGGTKQNDTGMRIWRGALPPHQSSKRRKCVCVVVGSMSRWERRPTTMPGAITETTICSHTLTNYIYIYTYLHARAQLRHTHKLTHTRIINVFCAAAGWWCFLFGLLSTRLDHFSDIQVNLVHPGLFCVFILYRFFCCCCSFVVLDIVKKHARSASPKQYTMHEYTHTHTDRHTHP